MGFARKVKRNAERARYERFSGGWRRERAYQLRSPGPEDGALLGRCPTRKEWVAASARLAASSSTEISGDPASPADPIVVPSAWVADDLEWKDG